MQHKFNSNKSSLKIEDLCNFNRFKTTSLAQKICFVLYIPFGVFLLCIRLLLCPIYAAMGLTINLVNKNMNKIILIKFMLWTMGYITQFKHYSENYVTSRSSQKIIVTNHVALSGFWVLSQLGGTIVANSDASILERWASAFSSVIYINNLKTIREKFTQYFLQNEKACIFISPEGTINNGEGLFLFQKFAFSLNKPIYPIAIKVTAPFGVNISTVSANQKLSHLCDYLWLFFLPFTKFELHFLPMQHIYTEEKAADFATRVQNLIAKQLDIPATCLCAKDKQQLRQRLKCAKKRAS